RCARGAVDRGPRHAAGLCGDADRWRSDGHPCPRPDADAGRAVCCTRGDNADLGGSTALMSAPAGDTPITFGRLQSVAAFVLGRARIVQIRALPASLLRSLFARRSGGASPEGALTAARQVLEKIGACEHGSGLAALCHED